MTKMSTYTIPLGYIFELDDLGWDDGRDLRLYGQASRSGIPRDHAVEDYEMLDKLTKATGKHLATAIVLGDFDKDNILRGEVGVTHDPYGWNRAEAIDLEKAEKCVRIMENADIDYMVHGLLHGRYTEDGRMINEHEFINTENIDGKETAVYISDEEVERHLSLFFKIYDSLGMKKPVRGFVNPGGICYASEKFLDQMSKVLYKFGIRYWADPLLSWGFDDTVLKVYNGVAVFRWKRNKTPMPWQAYDFDPDTLYTFNSLDDTRKSCLHGSHWSNFLRYNPKRNVENIPAWVDFFKRQGEVFGSMNSTTLAEAVNQAFYYQFADVEEKDGVISIDLCEVEKNKLDCHKDEFFISFLHGTEPKSCEGGDISLYEKHDEFDIYKIIHSESKVLITF